MANEINVSVSLSVANGNYSDSFSASGRFDQSTQLSSAGVIEVGTAVETISLGEITTAGRRVYRAEEAAIGALHVPLSSAVTPLGWHPPRPGRAA